MDVRGLYAHRNKVEKARQLYLELRKGSPSSAIEKIKKAIGILDSKLQRLESRACLTEREQTDIEGYQRAIGQHQAQLRILLLALAGEEVSISAEAEFERLIQLPEIVACQTNPSNTKLLLIVTSRLSHDGKIYDKGEWEFTVDREKLSAYVVRKTYLKDLNCTSTPANFYETGMFCFGTNVGRIDNNVKLGQYFQAISLAVRCLNTTLSPHLLEDCFPLVETE